MGRQKTPWIWLRRDGGSPGCRGGGEIISKSFFEMVLKSFQVRMLDGAKIVGTRIKVRVVSNCVIDTFLGANE